MSKLRKLCAVLLAVMMLISTFSTTILSVAAEETTEETTPVSITGSALDFLYNQAIELDAAYAEANGLSTPTKKDVLESQTGPWFISTSRSTNDHSWADAYYLWCLSSSEMRYGSNWTYWAPSVGVFGSGENRTLRAWLRNLSSENNDVYNDYVKLYYVAETSGVYKIAPDEFVVNSSDAEGYQAYVTIKVNGEEIFKSRPLQRKNRVETFDGAEVTLSEGDKIEWIFDYVVTDESGVYEGNMTFNFDPQLELLETVELEGTGEVAEVIYNAMNDLAASGTNKSAATTQTAVWREQLYKNSAWSDLTYYCNHSKLYTGKLDWAYNDGSYSQTDSMNLRYKNSNIDNGLILCARIPMTRWNMKQMRLAYTAELDGRYTLTDRLGYFEVNTGALTVYDYWVQITHNGTVIWKSDILANKGEKAEFNGVTVDMTAGDILAIEFRYSKKSDATATYDTTRMDVECAPVLSYKEIEPSVPYKASDAYNELFADFEMAEGDEALSGTLTQPTSGWIFEKGFDIGSLTNFTDYYYSGGDINWGHKILAVSSSYSGGAYPGVFINIGAGNGVSPAKGKLYVRYRGCTQSSGIQSTHEYAKDYAYSFIAPQKGTYLLSETVASLDVDTSAISDTVVKIYKNSSLIYQSEALTYANQSVTIPETSFRLDANDKVVIYFERQLDASVVDWNNNIRVVCDPTITYIPSSDEAVEKEGYTPSQTERYYAENITAPVAVSAWVNTNDVLAGDIFSSDNLTFSVNNSGYPVISYGEKEVSFAFDIRSNEWAHIAVSYDSTAAEWVLYYNGLAVSRVADSDYTATDIAKLYVGASMDAYNNSYFKGSVAELAFFSSALTADSVTEIYNAGVTAEDAALYLALSDVTSETALTKETVSVPAQDRAENGLIFLNQNYRLDLYETFEVPVNTFETWVRLESIFNADAEAGYIASSAQVNADKSNVGSAPCAMIEITTGGRPKLTFKDSSGQTDIIFNADIRSDDWVHLAITADYDAGYYYCYFNGKLVDKQATGDTQIPVTIRPYVVSGNYYNQNTPYYFQGDLAGITMFSDARTEEEIYNDIYGVDLEDSDLLGSWSLEGTGNILNRNGDGNDLHPFWAEEPDETVDESFGNYSTFVFIPDTQNNVGGTADISKWIIDNKDKENIIGVIGLGDITNNNITSQWNTAKSGYEPLKGVVPYVFTSGNHDIANGRDVTNFNTAFPYADWEPYMDGFFEEGKIDNMYTITEDVNGNKYMLLALEFMPRTAVLEWANEVVAANSDCKVIVSTHGYQSYSYTSKENYYLTDGYDTLLGDDKNAGDQIWEQFASKHENIVSVVCGHVYHEDIHATTNTGVNGNTVNEIIANAQTTDVLMKASSTIMILRVSEDGTKANINYLATEHGKYQKDLNQFTIDWIEGGYEEETVIGDITGDGAVNAQDLSSLRIKLMTNNEYDALYDVNKDGYFNIKDLVRLKKLCAGISSEGIAVTEGEVTINEKINIGYVTVDSDAVVASGTAAVTIDGGSYNGGSGASNTAVWAKEDATVIINDGNFYVGADANGDYNDLIYARDNAKVEIYGGFFEAEVPWSNNGKYYVLNVRNDSNATITVYGGTFVNYNPADGDDVVEGAITVAEGYEVAEEAQTNGDIWYTVVKSAE